MPESQEIELKAGFKTEDRRLDRIPQFDERSRQFPIRTLIQETVPNAERMLRTRRWTCPVFLDQGQEGSCVGHSIAHEMAATPVQIPVESKDAYAIYRRAQQLDEWPGEEPTYSGTSVLAGMKAAAERGFYLAYRWAFGLKDLVLAVSLAGPAVLGIWWYEGMYEPDDEGFIHPTGRRVGGHAILCRGVVLSFLDPDAPRSFDNLDLDKSYAILRNSWGLDYGDNGDAFITLRDLDRLLREDGECVIPVNRLRGTIAMSEEQGTEQAVSGQQEGAEGNEGTQTTVEPTPAQYEVTTDATGDGGSAEGENGDTGQESGAEGQNEG